MPQESAKRWSGAIPALAMILLSVVLFAPVRASTIHPKFRPVNSSTAETATAPLISEIMYNPPDDGDVQGANLEFIELHNDSDEPLDLSNARFSSGIDYIFATGATLPADTYLVLARSSADFRKKYGFLPYDQYDGQLDNAGERLTLIAADDTTLFSVRYDQKAPWPSSPDGSGFSLVLRDPDDATVDLDDGTNWRASSAEGGSPGAADARKPETPAIVVNEVLPHTDFPLVDSVEIHNPTDVAVDIGGWFLTDDRTQPRQYRIPDGQILAPNGYQVFTEDELGFSYSSFGEEAYLFAADALGNLSGYSHGFSFGTSANSVSFGRHLVSTGAEEFPAQSKRSLGAENMGPRVGPIVISEIMYHPSPNSDEYVRLTNISSDPEGVRLYDALYPRNTWRFNGIGNYVLPEGIILPAGGELLIVPTTPALFRAKYAIPAEIQITGPFTGTLNNSGERLQLLEPDDQDTDGTVPYFVVDEIQYSDAAPWPPDADGHGPSLRRIDLSAYGNDPANWRASNDFRFFLPQIGNNVR